MTKAEANKAISDRGDIWLNRIESLKGVYLSPEALPERRMKAFVLATVLNARVLNLMKVSLKVNHGPSNYVPGGYQPETKTQPSEWVPPNWMINSGNR